MSEALRSLAPALEPFLRAPEGPYAWVLALGLLAAIAGLAISARRAMRRIAELQREQATAERYHELQTSAEAQFAEIKGRLSAMAEMTAQRQAEQSLAVNKRLDDVAQRLGLTLDTLGRRVGENLARSAQSTADNLSRLNERLAVIEDARQSLATLSSEVVSLHGVLADKQARGAFGQGRMESIVQDALPPSAYAFQATLSNGRRPDCLIRLPNTAAPLVIDAKFPLEAFEAVRTASGAEALKAAMQAVRQTVGAHIEDIAGKYLIPGETQDTALMFVPSESIYADLHERFPDVVQRAHRARVFIVAPNILMLAISTVQAVIKDVRMREEADTIQREVGLLLADVGRLVDRAAEVDRHFALSAKALEKLSASADKVARRGDRLRSLELDDVPVQRPQPRLAAGE
ncbi:MAG: DNA recombination protein RmuC [Hyphomicrobiaceae bacterium]|nr:DNA recombination protein RmuC [Hyphomicrobiaceae bacterium]